MRRALAIAGVAAAVVAAPAPASAADSLYAVTIDHDLISFRSDAPRQILSQRPIVGLAPGEKLDGLDFRPASGELYGLGTSSRLYKIDPATGRAAAVGAGPFDPRLAGSSFGFDFNPAADRIRVVSDGDQNLRLDPNTGRVAAADKNLAFEAGASTQQLANPDVIASAYTNNVAGASSTQLYGLDVKNNTLVLQDPPNEGTVRPVARFNFPLPSRSVSFDITHEGNGYAAFGDGSLAGDGRAFLARVDVGNTVEPARPAANDSQIGQGREVIALAAVGPAQPQPADPAEARPPGPEPSVRVSAKRTISRAVLRRNGLALTARCSEACGLEAALTYRGATLGRARGRLGSGGVVRLVAQLDVAGRKALTSRKRRKLVLRVTASYSGADTSTSRGVVVR